VNALERFGPLLGRILLGLIFVISGFGKITGFAGAAGYIASKGLPVPQLLAIAAIIVELGGGILLIVGWKARWAAAALLVFTGLAALLFHNYWAMPPEQAQNQMIHFMKNVSIMGGMLYVAVYGAGPVSLEGEG
jgi:putative oxidoreductase